MMVINRVEIFGHQSPAVSVFSLRVDNNGVIHILDLGERGSYPLTEALNFQFYKRLIKMISPDYRPKRSRIFVYTMDGAIFEWFGRASNFSPLGPSDLPLICNPFLEKINKYTIKK